MIELQLLLRDELWSEQDKTAPEIAQVKEGAELK
jgi:hypothetical protein